MRRVVYVLGALLVVLGAFWAGRESSHGVTALWEHWWCPLPLIAIAIGLAGVLTTRRLTPAA